MLDRLKTFFVDCADAIRYKRDINNKISPDAMAANIRSIAAKPPADYGEVYHVTSGGNGEAVTATGITFFGELIPFRLDGNTTVQEVVCTEEITTIPMYVFRNSTALNKITFYGNIDTIEQYAFSGSSIQEIIGPHEEINIIPETVTNIPDYCFSNCVNLNNLTLSDGIINIGTEAFSLNSIGTTIETTKLPESLQTIGGMAFKNRQIQLTKIPANITTINAGAFYQNYSMTTLTFKGKPTTISSTAFQYCNNLTTINVPWAEGAVANAPWGAVNATINYNYTA